MKYKRLTTKDEEGNWQVWEDDYSHPFEALQVAIDRLAELEDKIEQGTLIELPFKVGDTVYRIIQPYREMMKIAPYTVKEIIIDKKGVSYLTIALKGASTITCKVKLKDVVLTREEAEAKLKELQE